MLSMPSNNVRFLDLSGFGPGIFSSTEPPDFSEICGIVEGFFVGHHVARSQRPERDKMSSYAVLCTTDHYSGGPRIVGIRRKPLSGNRLRRRKNFEKNPKNPLSVVDIGLCAVYYNVVP